MLALEIAFWLSVALLVHTHVIYPLSLWVIARLRGREATAVDPPADLPTVSLIIAAHDEEKVIAHRLRNARDLDYPRDLLELIVASDGSSDRTVELARAADADVVLDLPRAGKVEAQNAAVEAARGELLAFSDANSFWSPDALRRLVARFADPRVGYVCGQVRLLGSGSENEEGTYWHYEMAVRELESELGGITAGNGAIYATRPDAYVVLDSARGHDLSFPFTMTRRGWRALYAPDAVAQEKMAPTIAGEFARKRRMMARTWGVVLGDRMLSPRGYGPLYAFEILSHRALRYAAPFLHLLALGTNIALLGEGAVYTVTLALQAAFVLAALLGSVIPLRPLRLAWYYAVVEGSIIAGLWDRLRSRRAVTWEKVEGTR
ncbi:MAG TPA: glycosyltransferase family 2 protein [Solirubrobacterales bacterium]|jgi:cellulose synthase/poly-beta-1,6-N-acetylglucosamine synthase-like glycosyltransferase|nr:glycosyltransferase family 2 protein [Solirubrobacterales bacterium]